MINRFIRTYEIRWQDLDPNRHVANTAYGEFGNDTRLAYFDSYGIDMAWFEQHQFGPILFRETLHYLKEFHYKEQIHVELEMTGLSEDCLFSSLALPMYNDAGELGIYMEVFVSWMDLANRKLASPPAKLADALQQMPKAKTFRVLTKADTRVPGIPKDRTLDSLG